MAGTRTKPLRSRKYQGWFTDLQGNRRFFVGTKKRAGTRRMAERLEDELRQVRLGYRPAPKSMEKHLQRSFTEVAEEYLAWGESQGGRGGRPWGKVHARHRRSRLNWWQEKLVLETLGCLEGVLPCVEAALRDLRAKGRACKTLQHYAESIKSLCRWCVERGYLPDDPLKRLQPFDTTPQTMRRALTPDEVQRLLGVTPEHRRLLYEAALLSGLRANELRSPTPAHLDAEGGGIRLDAAWTKNRRSGFQPMPASLLQRLAAFGNLGTAARLYEKFNSRCDSTIEVPDVPLLYVPSHPSRDLDRDLKVAGIPKRTPAGKIDFHSLRVTYVTMVCEAGATVKEAQTLARHCDPRLTMNVYARAREGRLGELAEAVGQTVLTDAERALARISHQWGGYQVAFLL